MNNIKKLSVLLLSTMLIINGTFSHLTTGISVLAATLDGGFVSISDSRPSQSSVSYTLDFDNITTATTIRCIEVVFSTAASGGSAPTGMVTSSASYNAASSDYVPDVQTWTASSPSAGTVQITNTTGEQPGASDNGTVVIGSITNGSTAGTAYFAQFTTYTDASCTGGNEVDNGVVAFIYTAGISASVTVDPSLSFSVAGRNSGTTINGDTTNVTTTATAYTCASGDITATTSCIGGSLLTVGTNASNGYTVYIRYTGALTSAASDTISTHTGTNGSPTAMSTGTEGFGYTTEDSTLSVTGDGADRFTNPGQEYAGFTTSNAEVMYNSGSTASDVVEIGYRTDIASNTEAGTYTSTIILTATPTY